ncbi:MAG: chromosomal replication initiator protein DnaA [Pseudomonadota bacterium]
MSGDELWARCLSRLEGELSGQEMYMYIRPLQAHSAEGVTSLMAPNEFVLNAVRDNHLLLIEQTLSHLAGSAVDVELFIGSVGGEEIGTPTATAGASSDPRIATNLDPAFRFDNFVRGKSNEMAQAAALQVADNPGHNSYNPLLLYGSTGLGKTHLLHAVGNHLVSTGKARVMYLHSEQFVSRMVQALRHNSIDEFKKRYRTADALLIDDIQFFANKERSQEEFFHTFNTLIDGKQQVILTCDRYPRDVDGLESRLQSRFGSGLSVSIEPPDFETRAAILIAKAAEKDLCLNEEVALLIARHVQSNVRELEGALNTLWLKAHITKQEVTAGFAKEALRELLSAHQRQCTIPNIQQTVSDYYHISVAEMVSKRRSRNIARPRQMAMCLAKELTEHSLPEIGRAFGGRDHTTVLHAYRKIHELCSSDGRLHDDHDKLVRALTQ